MDPGTEELTLTPEAKKLIQALGSQKTKVFEIVAEQDKAVFEAIRKGLHKVNEEDTFRAQKVCIRVLARPFPKGTVPFGALNVPFGSAQKPIMCPLVPPQNQHIFNTHLNYLNLETVWALNIELSEH